MNNGITLLRCMLMYLVVLHHTICHTRLATEAWLFPLFLLTVPAVDGFLSISGWFGIKFSWRKVGTIFGQIIYYAFLSSLFSFIAYILGLASQPKIAIGQAWYGVAYIALMLISPVVNAGLESLHEQKRLMLAVLGISVLLVGDYVSRWIGLGFTVNGFGSHTLATFVSVYILTWAMRRNLKFPLRIFALAFIIYFASFCVVRVFTNSASCVEVISNAGFYNCPLVILTALGLVAFCSSLRVPEKFASVLRFISPSMFAVYLIHDASPVGKQLLLLRPIDEWGYNAFWSIGVFMIALIIDMIVRRFPIWLLRKIFVRG